MALDPNTRLSLHNGQVKLLSEINIGDQLMGDDSLPRTVIAIEETRQKAFEIIPHRGERIVCSEDHPLILRKSPYLNTLRNYQTKHIRYPNQLCVRANDLLSRGKSFCRSFLLYKVPINYQKVNVLIDPYFLGVWLGDGHSNIAAITTMDEEIKKEVYKQARIWGLKISAYSAVGNKATVYNLTRGNLSGFTRDKNPLLNALRGLNLIRNKHIPAAYLLNDRETRLKLLAGIIDSDGYLKSNYYSVTQKNKILLEQIAQLANSLGFRTVTGKVSKSIKSTGFKGIYYSVSISGKINEIPVKVAYKKATNISPKYDRRAIGYIINPVGIQKLIVIKTDQNRFFLHADGTLLSPDSDHVPPSSSYTDQRFSEAWEKRLKELTEFIKKKKRLPLYSAQNERKLRNWIDNAHSRIRSGFKSKDRQSDLMKLGIPFDFRNQNFEKKFSYLLNFRKKYPNRWPVYQQEYRGVKLGEWCRNIRKAYRKGKLSKIRIAKLNEIGFPFDVFESKWELQLKYLKEFRSLFNRNPFQKEEYPKGNPLGTWYYRHKNKSWMEKILEDI